MTSEDGGTQKLCRLCQDNNGEIYDHHSLLEGSC